MTKLQERESELKEARAFSINASVELNVALEEIQHSLRSGRDNRKLVKEQFQKAIEELENAKTEINL